MRLPRNLFFLALALTIVWVCSAQDNQNPISRNESEKKDSGTTIKPLEIESSERSTEQSTSTANMELGRLARQAQDVIWTDPGTGLMWTKEDNGGRINWNEANRRQPPIRVVLHLHIAAVLLEELSGIFDKTQNVGGYHIKGGIHLSLCCEWSSSTGLDSNQRWLLHFMGGGRVSGRLDYTFPVLCVRNATK